MDVLELNQQPAAADRFAQAGNVGDHIHEQDYAKALPLWRWPTPSRASKATGGGTRHHALYVITTGWPDSITTKTELEPMP